MNNTYVKKYSGVKAQCKKCKKEYQPRSSHHVFCSFDCRPNSRRNSELKRIGIPSGTVGAISELVVIADLLRKGYAVFRAVSQSCFCDVIAIKDKETMLVEARTGYKADTGNLVFPKRIHSNGAAVPTHYAVYIDSTKEISYIKVQ